MTTVIDVKEFWERNLCLDKFLKSEYLSKEYFEEGSRLRYKYHYHIPEAIRFLRTLKMGGKVLEIGLGVGADTQLLCSQDFDVTGIDLTEKSVAATRARLEAYGFKADIRTGNAEALEFDDNTFDVVYSFGVLHHTPDTSKSISEVRRVLKLGGIALVMLYHRNSLNYLVHMITNTSFDGPVGDPCPEEKAYSVDGAGRLFRDFSSVYVNIDYLFGTGWGKLNLFMPEGLKKWLARCMGWHLMIWGVK